MYKRDPLTGLWRRPPRGLCSLLPGLGLMAPGFGAKAAGVAVEYIGTVEDTGTDNQSNFSFSSFSGRAVAIVTANDAATVYTASSITIDGNGASIHVDSGGVTVANSVVIASAAAGGSVVVNWSEAIAGDQVCTLLRLTGLGAAAYDTAITRSSSVTAAAGISGNIDCAAGGVIIGGFVGADRTMTWTLTTEDVDQASSDGNTQHSVAHQIFASAQTNLSVNAKPATDSNTCALALVSFSPA